MVGTLLRQLRLEQNYSQESLTYGICAASYLSKIEQGQVEPGTEILDQLFRALGVTYCTDADLLIQARKQLDRYLEAREQDVVDQASAQWLDKEQARLICSPMNLWMGLYQICRLLDIPDREGALALCRQMKSLETGMDALQRYRYLLCTAEATADPVEALDCVRQAARWNSCGHVYWAMAYVHFHLGQYSCCVEIAERAYSMAADEGDLYVLMWSSFLLGCCYSEMDLALSEKYFRRAIRLSRPVYPPMEQLAAYNLGASCLENGQLEQALHWLLKAEEIPEEQHHNLLLHQKRAILFAELNRKEESLRELEAADRVMLQMPETVRQNYEDMLTFARLMLEGQQKTAEFEGVILRLCKQTGAKWGYGFCRFYSLYLVKLYRSQRRYKDALRIMEELHLPEKSMLNTVTPCF